MRRFSMICSTVLLASLVAMSQLPDQSDSHARMDVHQEKSSAEDFVAE